VESISMTQTVRGRRNKKEEEEEEGSSI